MSKMTSTQMMEQMMSMMAQMSARLDALENAKAETPKDQPKRTASSEKELVPFTKKDGTTVMVSKKQAEAWERYRSNSKPLTEGQKARVEAIKASKAKEPELTRKLEKALGLPKNSLESTACTADQCRALGWKGTRKELKAIKAKVRSAK